MGNKSSKVDNKEPKQTKLKVGDVVGGRVIKSINKEYILFSLESEGKVS